MDTILVTDTSYSELTLRTKKFLRPINNNEINLVEIIGDKFKHKLSAEKYYKLWENDEDIKQAVELNTESQMILLNKYFCKYLLLKNDSFELRKKLCLEKNPSIWIKNIENNILDYFFNNNLPDYTFLN